MLELLARDEGAASYADLDAPTQAALRSRVQRELRTNTWDPAQGTIHVSPLRAQAMLVVGAHYMSLFSTDPATAKLRATRSEERRVGNEWVSTCRSRWSPYH